MKDQVITPQGHSPLGASGTHRWMHCPGSVGLAHGIDDEEDDTFSRPGTVAHVLGEFCLKTKRAPWQFVGWHYDIGYPGFVDLKVCDPTEHSPDLEPIDKEMADAVQVYLDAIEAWHPERHQGNTWVERRFHCPTIHRLFYGTADLVHLDLEARVLHVWDYKHGAGIMVEVDDNPQCKYYACGVLEDLDLWNEVDEVVLHIVQPRGYLDPHRVCKVSTDDLDVWMGDVLVPAMDAALVSRNTKSGEHCRFCPVRYRQCPSLMQDMEELETMLKELEGRTAEELTNEQVARILDLFALAKIVNKAAEQTAFKRLQNGKPVPGYKLASARANRAWKDEDKAKAVLEKTYGDRAYTARKLLSPAQIEALPLGAAIVAEHAYKPDAGLTVVKGTDARPAVNKETKSLFQPVARKGKVLA